MNKFEILEELKRKMTKDMMSVDVIPEEVFEIIKKTFDNLINIYNQLQCNYSQTEEYIIGNLEIVKSKIINNIGNDVRQEQLAHLMYILRRIENSFEIVTKDEQEREQRTIKNAIYKEEDYRTISERISQIISDSLMNIRVKQNVLLGARQYSDSAIEKINQTVQQYIRNLEDENSKKIYKVLEDNQKIIIEKWLEEYENYIKQEEKQDEEEITKKTPKEEWNLKNREEFSLENQREFIKKQIEKKTSQNDEKEKKELRGLPSDIMW